MSTCDTSSTTTINNDQMELIHAVLLLAILVGPIAVTASVIYIAYKASSILTWISNKPAFVGKVSSLTLGYLLPLAALLIFNYSNTFHPVLQFERTLAVIHWPSFWMILAVGFGDLVLIYLMAWCRSTSFESVMETLFVVPKAMEDRLEKLLGIEVADQVGFMLALAPVFEIWFLALAAIDWECAPLSQQWLDLSWQTLTGAAILAMTMYGSLAIDSIADLLISVQRSAPAHVNWLNLNAFLSGLAIFTPTWVAGRVGDLGRFTICAVFLPEIIVHVMLCHVLATRALPQGTNKEKGATPVPAVVPRTDEAIESDEASPQQAKYLQKLELTPGSKAAHHAWSYVMHSKKLFALYKSKLQDADASIAQYKNKLAATETKLTTAELRLEIMRNSQDECTKVACQTDRRDLQSAVGQRDTFQEQLKTARGEIHARFLTIKTLQSALTA